MYLHICGKQSDVYYCILRYNKFSKISRTFLSIPKEPSAVMVWTISNPFRFYNSSNFDSHNFSMVPSTPSIIDTTLKIKFHNFLRFQKRFVHLSQMFTAFLLSTLLFQVFFVLLTIIRFHFLGWRSQDGSQRLRFI